jgi:hypothetical protein
LEPKTTPAKTAVGSVSRGAPWTELRLAGKLLTRNENFYSAYQNISWAKDLLTDLKVVVPIATLNPALNECEIPCGFELLVADVEGREPEVFAEFDLARWKPKILIVQLQDYHPEFVGIEAI